MATLAFRTIEEDLVVYVGADAPPDNAEWQTYVDDVAEAWQRWRSIREQKGRVFKFFVFVDDSSPNAAQRAAVWKAIGGPHGHRSAVVTSSLIARKIITAFGWLGAPMRGFSPRELGAAAAYLDLGLDRLPSVIRTARVLARSVGSVRVLDEIPEVASASPPV
jgi:hypothetical protein